MEQLAQNGHRLELGERGQMQTVIVHQSVETAVALVAVHRHRNTFKTTAKEESYTPRHLGLSHILMGRAKQSEHPSRRSSQLPAA